jgi:bifunctional enzyme CysN/CysC
MKTLSQLKIIICGSVDDGKSTLLGRILSETRNISLDQKEKLKIISKRYGTTNEAIDYALIVDGLQDEREQGITIDVAYKYINYKTQRLVFCDSPGHDQYTRNVVTAASNCHIGIVLIDSAKGVLQQTARHLAILNFVGIEHIIFAVNKIDAIHYNQKKIKQLFITIKNILNNYQFKSKFIIPISALNNENITKKSKKLFWYKGKNLLDQIINIKINEKNVGTSYIPIQHVHRPSSNIRQYMGTASGIIKKKEPILVLPSETKTSIKNIFFDNKKINATKHNAPVSIETKNQLDIARGDVIVLNKNIISIGNFFNASIVVTSNDNIYSGRQYLIRIHNKEIKITVTKIKGKQDINSSNLTSAKYLSINDLGEIEFDTHEKIVFAPFQKIKELGRFIIIDIENNNVVAAGIINFALRRSGNVFKSKVMIDNKKRSELIRQKSICIWLTGISGSGKTTIANALEQKLHDQKKLTYLLDADNLRLGINKDLGFSKNDRIENIRRIGEIARLMKDAGLIVIVAAISPYEKERMFVKSLLKKEEFFEIFVNTPLAICVKRDSKGLYQKARKDKFINKTGLGINYEIPKNPDLEVDTSKQQIMEIVDLIVEKLFN